MSRIIAMLVALGVVSCGGESVPTEVCSAGVEIACRCTSGSLGVAMCSGDGSAFGACDCSGNPGAGGGSSSSSSSSSSTGGASGCTDDLSNIGTNDFTISLELATAQPGGVAVVNQRDACQQEMFWDLRVNGGPLEMETSDSSSGTDYIAVMSSVSVNDGALHKIVIRRVSEALTIEVDGTPAGGGTSTAAFGALPPLAKGVDVCDGSAGGDQPLSGTLTNVCITSP